MLEKKNCQTNDTGFVILDDDDNDEGITWIEIKIKKLKKRRVSLDKTDDNDDSRSSKKNMTGQQTQVEIEEKKSFFSSSSSFILTEKKRLPNVSLWFETSRKKPEPEKRRSRDNKTSTFKDDVQSLPACLI